MYDFDLHTHTAEHSLCGRMGICELIQRAQETGLSGVCLTDHNYQWSDDEIAAARIRCRAADLVILSGIEVDALDPQTGACAGHLLIYGLQAPLPGGLSLAQIVAAAHAQGAFVIAAHPFRPGSGLGELNGSVEVDAVEVYNLQNDQRQTDRSRQLALAHSLPAVAGSDAHHTAHLGLHRTVFERRVTTVAELAEEIRARRFTLRTLDPQLR